MGRNIAGMQIIELRQYTLHPGRRDELIELFERELIEPQEAAGMRLIGLFRDLGNADRFVWLRGFADMAARRQALEEFYGGPVWRAHRDAANATMLDSYDVLLLKPAHDGAGFADAPQSPATSLLHATLCELTRPVDDAFVDDFCRAAAGSLPLACLRTETAVNDYPALPVRQGEHVVGLSRAGVALPSGVRGRLKRPPTLLRLQPTARSRLR